MWNSLSCQFTKACLKTLKRNLQKCGEKSATRKKWCQSCYQGAYSCIFISCILYQLNFRMQKNTLNYVFVLYLISKWNLESWYATKYRYFNKTWMIPFLHLKMGKPLHESETSNDNDIDVYGVLVEIWLELIIQNRTREKKNLFERNPKY